MTERHEVPAHTALLFFCRALTARLEQEASVDPLVEREKVVPLDLLDPLDSLDPLLVPFTPLDLKSRHVAGRLKRSLFFLPIRVPLVLLDLLVLVETTVPL